MKKNNVPKLRFEGFTDDWQQRKWIEIVKRVNTSSSSKFHRRIEFEDINSGFGELIDKGKVQKRNTRKGILFQPKSILFGKLRPYLKNWIQPDFEGIAIGDFWVFEAQDTAPEFDYFLMQSSAFQKVANDTSGTKMPRSDWKVVSTTKFQIPLDFSEQQKIGQLFQTLDSRIIQQKKQIELFKRLKKGYLQKIFNQEVRFSGFTQDWGMKKLGEVILKNSEKNKEVKFNNVESISNKFGFVGQSDYFENRTIASQDTSNYYVIRKGAFAFNPSRINVGSIAVKLDENISIVSPLYISFYTEKDLKDDFLWNWFKSKHFEKQRQLLTEGGVRDTLNYEALSEMVITLPTTIEQKSIGSFFEVLDSQISQADEKLSRLIKLKKAYLQKMFV